MCLKEIGLCAQNMITILGAIVNITGGHLHDHLMNMRIFTLIMGKIYMWASKWKLLVTIFF